jgi:hypothetical protein
MTATISYHYRDDGLSLAPQDNPQYYSFQNGLGAIFVTSEAAAIYVYSSNSCYHYTGPACSSDYSLWSGSTYNFSMVFLAANDRPEDIRGEIPVWVGVRWDPPPFYYGQGFTAQRNLYIDVSTQVQSVAAIPEPSSWAMMLGPLLGLGLLARRRQGIAARR